MLSRVAFLCPECGELSEDFYETYSAFVVDCVEAYLRDDGTFVVTNVDSELDIGDLVGCECPKYGRSFPCNGAGEYAVLVNENGAGEVVEPLGEWWKKNLDEFKKLVSRRRGGENG